MLPLSLNKFKYALAVKEFKGSVASHGKQWKEVFKGLMLNFLPSNIFPKDITTALSIHLMNPSASSCNDFDLSLVFKYASIFFSGADVGFFGLPFDANFFKLLCNNCLAI